MKKTVSLILAVMMLLSCMSITAFATDNNTTEITAVKAAPLSYKIVIPQAVTITEAGVVEIGTPSVETVTGATANTVISYTATGTQLTLENSDKTMATSYYTAYTDATTNTPLTSTAIKVYKNSAVVDPLTKLYVGVTEDDWNAADAGTYTATVTFDFDAKEFQPAYIDGFSVMILRTTGGATNMYNIYTGNKPGKQLTNVAEAVLLKCTAKEITGDSWFAFDDVEINGNEYIMHGNAYSAEPTNLLEQGYIKLETEKQLIEWLGLTYVG